MSKFSILCEVTPFLKSTHILFILMEQKQFGVLNHNKIFINVVIYMYVFTYLDCWCSHRVVRHSCVFKVKECAHFTARALHAQLPSTDTQEGEGDRYGCSTLVLLCVQMWWKGAILHVFFSFFFFQEGNYTLSVDSCYAQGLVQISNLQVCCE